jgi:DinB superfamily
MSAWSDLLSELARMPDELAHAIGQVPSVRLRYRPESWGGSPGETFCPIEHVCHVRDIERDGYHVRIRRMLEESNPSLISIDGDELAKQRRYEQDDVGAALSAFRAAREETIALLRGLDDAQLAREGFFAEYGPLTLRGLVHYLRSHDQQHLAGIQWLAGKIASEA